MAAKCSIFSVLLDDYICSAKCGGSLRLEVLVAIARTHGIDIYRENGERT
jgi:hypothetical protein